MSVWQTITRGSGTQAIEARRRFVTRPRDAGRMARRLILAALLAAMLAALLALPPHPVHAQSNARVLAFFQIAGGAINDSTPVEEWTFTGYAGQIVSLIVQAASGDLDPTLSVLGPDGALVAENDDLDSLVRDAGLEALRLPDEGTYTARISRYGGANGTTRGSYRLSLTPGFARLASEYTFDQGSVSWQTPGGVPVGLSAGWLRVPVETPGGLVLALPPEGQALAELYFQVDSRLFRSPSYGEFGLIFRVQGAGSQLSYYALRVNSRGQWTAIRHEPNGEAILRTWTSHPALDPAGVTLAVLVRGDTFTFFADGQMVGEVRDSGLTGAGRVGVLAASDAGQTDSPQAMFDNVIVTARLGTTYAGLPLALAEWQSPNPATIVEELVTSGQVTPAAVHDLFIPQKIVNAATELSESAQFELLGVETTQYDNFIMGAALTAISTRDNVACGIVFRWTDERDFSLAYTDSTGGWGLVQTENDALTANAYDLSAMITPGSPSTLLVIAQDSRLALYVNGALVAQEEVSATRGRVGVALLNYEAAQTTCYYYNLWVWPLVTP